MTGSLAVGKKPSLSQGKKKRPFSSSEYHDYASQSKSIRVHPFHLSVFMDTAGDPAN